MEIPIRLPRISVPKIKDRITLGIVAGTIAAFPGRLINTMEYRVGLTNFRYGETAAGLFMSAKQSRTVIGDLVGRIANQITVSATGVAGSYLLSLTGKDNAILKGAGLGAIYWMGIFGLSSKASSVMTKSKNPQSVILAFIDHIIFGVGTAYLITKLGDESVFTTNSKSARKTFQKLSTQARPDYPIRDASIAPATTTR